MATVIRKSDVRTVERFRVPEMGEAPRARGHIEDRVGVIFPTAGELEGIRANAFDQGFSAGKAEGLIKQAEVVERLSLLVESIDERCRAVEKSHLDLFVGLLDEVLDAISGGAALDTIGKVRRAVDALCPAGNIKVLMNPEELHEVGDVTGFSTTRSDVVFEPSSGVRAGGFLIRHSAGELDCTVEAAVAAVLKVLSDARSS
jgi:flagellar biosynthesis/type III secretory pathway protein FliH